MAKKKEEPINNIVERTEIEKLEIKIKIAECMLIEPGNDEEYINNKALLKALREQQTQ